MANVLGELFAYIASAIREKTGDAEKMKPADFPEKISSIETGTGVDVSGVTAEAEDVLKGKTIVDADGNAVEGSIEINETPLLYKRTLNPQNQSISLEAGYYPEPFDVTVRVAETLSITPTKKKHTQAGSSHFYRAVTCEPIPDEYQDITGVTAKASHVLEGRVFVDSSGAEVEGTISVCGSPTVQLTPASSSVDITPGYYSGGRAFIDLEEKTVTPTKEQQIVEPSEGKVLSKVTVEPVTDSGEGVPDVDVSGVTATAADVLTGKTIVDAEGNKVDGTMPNRGAIGTKKLTPDAGGYYNIQKGYYESGVLMVQSREISVVPSKSLRNFNGVTERTYYDKVYVDPIPDQYQDVSNVTATADDVRSGKIFVDAEGNEVEGALSGTIADVSDVTANAEDVLEGKVIVTSTGSKVYGALAVDNLNPGEVIVYKKKKVSGFALDSTFGAFSPGYVSPSEFTLEGGKSYRVIWDGAEWNCDAFAFEMSGMSIVAIGNASSLGLSGNNEPFLITYNVTADNTQIFAIDDKDTHTIGIYQKVSGETGSGSDDNFIWVGSTSSGVSNSVVGNGIIRYVTFMNHDGSVEYGKKSVIVGEDCVDPVAAGHMDTPTRESTAQYNYTFSGGWATVPNGGKDANALKAVNEDRTVYANYVSAVRYYTITFYDSDGTTVLTTMSVAYGSVPSYTPVKDGHSFNGWSPELVAVTGNASYSAQWEEKITFAKGSWADIAKISEEGKASEYFKVGDTRTITFDGSSLTLSIAGFDHDDLADGSGKAGMTIVAMNAPTTTKLWHWSDNITTGLYNACDLNKTDLTNWFSTKIPSDLRKVIKSVNKDYETSVYMGTATPGKVSCNLFLLSLTELGGQPSDVSYYAVLGSRYALFPSLYAAKAPTINMAGTTTKVAYWIRNLNRVGVLRPAYIDTSGTLYSVKNTSVATTQYYVRFGFCI